MAKLPSTPCAVLTLRLKELIATRLGSSYKLLFCHRPALSSRAARLAGRAGRHIARHSMSGEMVELVGLVPIRGPVHTRCLLVFEHTCTTGRSDGRPTYPDDEPRLLPPRPGSWARAIAQISSRPLHAGLLARGGRLPSAGRPASGCERGSPLSTLPSTLVWFDGAGRHMESLDSERPVGERLRRSLTAVTELCMQDQRSGRRHRALVTLAAAESLRKMGDSHHLVCKGGTIPRGIRSSRFLSKART